MLLEYNEYFNKYDKLCEVGKGRFGTVYKVKNLETDKRYASKHIRFWRLVTISKDIVTHQVVLRSRKEDQRQKVLGEIGILKKICNPHIIKFIEAFGSCNEIIIITEYLNGGELFDRWLCFDI